MNQSHFLTSPDYFRWVVILSDIWKETGWSTILYLAALLAISPDLYEAAAVDGATPLQRIWYISLPGILPVIVLVTLLRLGHILEAGFNQIFVLYSVPVYSVGDILDTWVYRQGVLQFQFSLATAVGFFKGVIGLVLILVSNRVAKRCGAAEHLLGEPPCCISRTRDAVIFQIGIAIFLTIILLIILIPFWRVIVTAFIPLDIYTREGVPFFLSPTKWTFEAFKQLLRHSMFPRAIVE